MVQIKMRSLYSIKTIEQRYKETDKWHRTWLNESKFLVGEWTKSCREICFNVKYA